MRTIAQAEHRSETGTRGERADERMRIDLWSDVVCPWCWLGTRRLQLAIGRLGLERQVEIVPRSFELGPRDATPQPALQVVARKYGGTAQRIAQMVSPIVAMGAELGLIYDFDRSIACPTFDAHRLIHAATVLGLGIEMAERLHRAAFAEGADVSDHATLRALASEVGIEAPEAERVLTSDAYTDAVEEDEALARTHGIRGVPFAVVDGRYAVSGAQTVEIFEQALARAQADRSAPQ